VQGPDPRGAQTCKIHINGVFAGYVLGPKRAARASDVDRTPFLRKLHYSLTCSSMGSASASRSISVKSTQRSSNKRENDLCYSCITLRMCIDFAEDSTAVYLSIHISHHTRHCGAQAYVHLSLGFEPTWPSLLCCPQLLHRVVSTGLLQSWHSQCWSRRSWLASGVPGPQRQSTAKPRAFAREVWPRGHEVPAVRPARGGTY
jgi:hypothetical protein